MKTQSISRYFLLLVLTSLWLCVGVFSSVAAAQQQQQDQSPDSTAGAAFGLRQSDQLVPQAAHVPSAVQSYANSFWYSSHGRSQYASDLLAGGAGYFYYDEALNRGFFINESRFSREALDFNPQTFGLEERTLFDQRSFRSGNVAFPEARRGTVRRGNVIFIRR